MNVTGKNATEQNSRLWLVILGASLIILRLPALMYPILDVDEAIYALFSRIWFDGGVPYLDCVETKPLGIYFIYGLIFSIFGKFNMTAVHAVTIGVAGMTAYVIYLIANALQFARGGPWWGRADLPPPAPPYKGGANSAGLWAALFYIVFSTTYIPKYIATTIEPIMLLPVALQYYLWLRYEREGNSSFAFLSGLSFSAACLFKYQAGMNLIILIAYLALFRKNFGGFAKFLIGAIPLPLVMVAYLWRVGALDSFIFWAVSGNSAYISGGSEAINLGSQILTRVLPFIASTALLWILSIAGATRNIRSAPAQKWLIILWFILSFVPVSMGKRFYGHYFLLLIPSMAILAAPVAAKIFEDSGRAWRKSLVIFWILFPALGFFTARFFISGIHTAAGEDNMDDYKPIASYVKSHTAPSDRILVWGYAASIYWFAERLPSSRFFWSDLVAGRVPASQLYNSDHEKFVMPEAKEMFMDDLARHRPAYIIDTSPAKLHDYGDFPIINYKELADYLNQYYREETRINNVVFYKRRD